MWDEYRFVNTVEHALDTLSRWSGNARLIAGGTDLVLDVRSGKHSPRCVVDITRIPGLDSIEENGDYIIVGANVTFHDLWTSSIVDCFGHVLSEAAHNLGAYTIQNVATLAGNVASAMPAGDGTIALLALGAEAEIANLSCHRWVGVNDLFAGPGVSKLDSNKEMITRFRWRKAGPRQASTCERIAKGEVMSLPIASCAVDLQMTEGMESIEWARVALGPVAPTPFRAICAEDFLRGACCDEATFVEAAEQAASVCQMRTCTIRATKDYREQVIMVLVERALKRAVHAARSGSQKSIAGRFNSNRKWSDYTYSSTKADRQISFVINGKKRTVEAKPGQMLADFIREDLKLTGTKVGCDEGGCGACTVLIEGQPVISCIYPAFKAQGCQIDTIEEVGSTDNLHPVQEAFSYHDAIQCGFCTPGMVLSTKALLEVNPDPSIEEIKVGLGNNYCRCTGYKKIIEAIQDASLVMQGKKDQVERKSEPRKDAVSKVTGLEVYAGDMQLAGMLYGKVVWSEFAHAEILSIDSSKAKNIPGVVKVITYKDIPGQNLFGSMGYDQPALAEGKVLFGGEAVAVVYAETLEAANEGAALVSVDYREVPGIYLAHKATDPDAPVLKGENNVFHETLVEKGDIKTGFDQAEILIEDDYETQVVEHLYLETESGIGVMEDGIVTIYQGTQWPPGDRMQLADILGLSQDKIRVVPTPVGGAFGGKMDLTTQPFLALGTYLTGRPVKIVLTRSESIRMHVKRHPSFMHYKLGATREGKIVALQAHLLFDGGAYRSTTDDVLEQATVFSSGPYDIPNVRLTGKAVRTNNVPRGAMRGFGAQQITFAMESQMDQLALRLDMDPFEIRRMNMYDVGSALVTGQVLRHSIGAKPTLDAVEQVFRKMSIPAPKPGKHIGVGLASGMKNVGLGIGNDDSVYVALELKKDGRILLKEGAVDLGQGANSAMCQIVAESLGLEFNLIDYITGDTALSPDGGITAASRQTHITGRACYNLSIQFMDVIKDYAAQTFDIPPDILQLTSDGRFKDRERDGVIGTLEALAREAEKRGEKISEELHYEPPKTYRILTPAKQNKLGISEEQYINYPTFCYGCQLAIVEVDEETGHVDVLKIIAAHDVGTAIRPTSAEGQVEGGVTMGLGYALTEDLVEENGIIVSDTFHKITVPRSTMPTSIETILVEDPDPNGPFGAKGIGEGASMPTAPAVINAIHNAVGARVKSIPATKDKILSGIQSRQPTC